MSSILKRITKIRNVTMPNKNIKIFAIVFILIVFVIILLLNYNSFVYSYIDINSGKLKAEYSILGFVYKTSVTQTPFSELVSKYGLKTGSPDWKYASKGNLGFRLGLIKSFGHSKYDKMINECNNFLGELSLLSYENQINDEQFKQYTKEFLEYLNHEDLKGMEKYILNIGKKESESTGESNSEVEK